MYKNTFLILFLFLLSPLAQAQKNGVDGYIVTSSSDTIYGKVKLTNFANLRGSKFIGNDGVKYKIETNKVVAFKAGKASYKVVAVSELGIKDSFKNNGSIYLKQVIEGPISLYSASYCFGKKTINDRQNKVYKERCPTIYYFKKNNEPYFEALRKEDVSIGKVKQKFSSAQIAGYFDDYQDLSKEILYQVIDRNKVGIMVKKYNDWKLNSK